MNILDIVKEDHEKVRSLFQRVEKSGRKDRTVLQQLFAQIKEELEIHMEGEERFLYPKLEQREEAREKVLEGYEEHQVAKNLIGTFTSLAVDDERWGAKLMVLFKVVEHHMQDEERGIFEMVRAAFHKGQLEEMGMQFKRHKREGRKPSRGASVEARRKRR